MCTLLVGYGIPDRETVLIAANRDEDPSRPSDPPGVLRARPRVAGGRDRVAGGTWLAIRERRAVVAMLNRRPSASEDAVPPTRSRGLLALDVASVAEQGTGGLDVLALAEARRLVGEARYSPFSLAFLSSESCWLLAHDGEHSSVVTEIAPGWHALTHADLDDSSEPRTARLLRALSGFRPRTVEDAERRMIELLGMHEGPNRDEPAVCMHGGRMSTVSSSFVALGRKDTRYRHAEGRPCEQPMRDFGALLEAERKEIGLA